MVSPPPPAPPVLNWIYYGDDAKPQGYASVAASMKKSLRNVGVDIETEAETIILHTIPWEVYTWYEGQRAGIFSMWEHSRLPEPISRGLARFDFAVVPCEFSRRLFEPYVSPVYVIPHGIDPTVFYPVPPSEEKREFTVLSAGTNLRKGVPEMVEGFRKAGVPNSHLVLKGSRALNYFKPEPNEFVIDKVDDMRELYYAADMYVSAARGEGWDLIAWEALACGVPTIVPKHTAYLDWGHLAQGWLENFDTKPSSVKLFGDPGTWEVMNSDEIAEVIWDVYKNQEDYQERALKSSDEIRTNWTWDKASLQFVSSLSPLRALEVKGALQERPHLVKVRGLREIPIFDVGGFEGGPIRDGASYLLPPEPARVLYEAGVVEFLPD